MTSCSYSADADRKKSTLPDALKLRLFSAQDHLTSEPFSGQQLDGALRLYSQPGSSLEITYTYDEDHDQIAIMNIVEVLLRFHIFVSYSRKDRAWLNAIREKLQLLRNFGIRFWADTDLCAGENWSQVLTQRLREARGALLLVSESFLTSDFIREEELRPILEAATGEFSLFWVAVEDYGAEGEPTDQAREDRLEMKKSIESYQAVINPDPPLAALDEIDRLKALDAIQSQIANALTP